ncbi:MAG: hypothetical protein KGV44_03420 [Flavobacteriaceae bacterium]|nr:hypothetical protein [Flavobacteriaceae bacterium]
MNTILQIGNGLNFLKDIWQQILDALPTVLLAIAFVICAWLFIKIFLFILKKILKSSKVDSLMTKLNESKIFGEKEIKVVPSKVITEVVRYLLILIFIIIISDMFKLNSISEGISKFIGYLPILISALAIFIIGVYIASVIKKSVTTTIKSLEMTGSKLIGNIIFYVIVLFVTITALNQAGINTEIITKNIILVMGALLISFTIAFGLGARDVVQRLLFGFYSKRNFQVGQRIKTKKIEGIIDNIDNICVKIKTENGILVIPIKEFVNQKVEIIG